MKPIRNDEDYKKALEELQSIFNSKKGTKNGDKAEILSILLADYESKVYKDLPIDPIEAIKCSMCELDMKPKDLIEHIGNKSSVSHILNRKRKLSISNIRVLSTLLNIPAEILIQDYEL